MATDTDWQAEAVRLKHEGRDSNDIAEAVGKSAPTVRKAIAKAREAGEVFPGDDVAVASNGNGHARIDAETADRLREAATGDGDPPSGPIPGQIDIDGTEHEDAGGGGALGMYDRFKAEAGEAVGPMPPSRAVDPQDGLFDKVWDDAGLLAALEAREQTREVKLNASKAHKLKDDEAKALLAKYSLEVGEVARIGRFRIKMTRTEGGEVSFVTEPRDQLRIGVEAE